MPLTAVFDSFMKTFRSPSKPYSSHKTNKGYKIKHSSAEIPQSVEFNQLVKPHSQVLQNVQRKYKSVTLAYSLA